MTRLILCDGCAEKTAERYGLTAPDFEGQSHAASIDGPAEFVKLVAGDAKARFMCDTCGHVICFLEHCWAYSIYQERAPYQPWESEFLVNRETPGRSETT